MKGAGEGLWGMGSVVEGLAEDDEVDGVRGEGRVLKIADAELEVLEAIFAGLFGAELDHFLGIIDGDDVFAPAREQLGEESFAGAQIGDGEGREDAEEKVTESLPGAAGAVAAVEAAGDLIEIHLSLFLATLEDAFEVDLIGLVFGEFAGALDGEWGDV
jgi:hypothetical protein